MASSWMLGVSPANYSGVHSKTTWPVAGFGSHFCKDPPTARPWTTAQHGKKTRSTPVGCRTTTTFINGNGKRLRPNDEPGLSPAVPGDGLLDGTCTRPNGNKSAAAPDSAHLCNFLILPLASALSRQRFAASHG